VAVQPRRAPAIAGDGAQAEQRDPDLRRNDTLRITAEPVNEYYSLLRLITSDQQQSISFDWYVVFST
jgi:hypothetical protein